MTPDRRAIVPGHRDKYALVERERRFLSPPPGSVADVTWDDRFTGGRLAVTPRPELLSWLAEHGVRVG